MTTDGLKISLPFYTHILMWTSAWAHTCRNACKSKQAPCKMMNGFHLQATGGKRQTFLPFGQLCFRQNNKRLNDIVSCPLWLQSGNGTTSLRQQLQMANLYIHHLFFPPLSCSFSGAPTETLADLKDRLISIESCWSVLNHQSITTYQGERVWRSQWKDRK